MRRNPATPRCSGSPAGRRSAEAPVLNRSSTGMPSVLVLDDEPRIAEFVARALEENGLTVARATDGSAGLAAVAASSFDLVVLDLLMPGLSGQGVLRHLRHHHPSQRVLVLSALSDVESKVRCLELGAADYLVKPFALAELVARVWARVRDVQQAGEDRFMRAGRLTLDAQRRTADSARAPIAPLAREFLVLKHL